MARIISADPPVEGDFYLVHTCWDRDGVRLVQDLYHTDVVDALDTVYHHLRVRSYSELDLISLSVDFVHKTEFAIWYTRPCLLEW